MTKEKQKSMQIAVCSAPGGNGFTIEHMPDFLLNEDFDNCQPHIHYFYEILWFLEGRGKHTIDFQEYDIEPNTLIFLSPGQIHHFDHNTSYRGYSIKMCTDLMRSDDQVNTLFLKYNIFHTFDTHPCFRIDEQTASRLSTLIGEMEEELQYDSMFGNIDVLKALLRIFMIKVLRHGVQENNMRLDNMKPSHLLFIRFRRMVEQEYMHLHTVQDYAKQLNVAVRTLNKSVNECAQMSPLSFINQRIILEAKRMVRYTNLMIKEIAYDLGYEDPSYFVKLFKRLTGYLPLEFRVKDQVTTECPIRHDFLVKN